MIDKKSPSVTEIARRTIFTASLATQLPKGIDVSEVAICAAEILKIIDYMRLYPNRVKEIIN